MPIDWFTVVAQAVNFLILVWLLKRFLYKPILNAIDAREKGIAAQHADATALKADAQKEYDDFQLKNVTFEKDHTELLKKNLDEAMAERQHLLDDAHKDADSLRTKQQEALQMERQNLNGDIVRWTQKEVFAIARKTLRDLACTSLDERMSDAFIERLRALNGSAKDQFAADLKTSANSASLRSAFDLPPAQRSAIESAVKEKFDAGMHIQFETAPDLVSGIELSTKGQKLCWSIADYLSTLEKSAGELLHVNGKPTPKPGSAAPKENH